LVNWALTRITRSTRLWLIAKPRRVVDGAGNLTSLSSGPIGQIAGSVAVSAMAFDLSRNLFVVDAFHNSLLKVAKSTAKVIYSVPLTGYLWWAPVGAGLAIDPATGIAYYAQGGYLSLVSGKVLCGVG
jgi:DNA-binding beta-propeller fold protein YncE